MKRLFIITMLAIMARYKIENVDIVKTYDNIVTVEYNSNCYEFYDCEKYYGDKTRCIILFDSFKNEIITAK